MLWLGEMLPYIYAYVYVELFSVKLKTIKIVFCNNYSNLFFTVKNNKIPTACNSFIAPAGQGRGLQWILLPAR